MILIVPSRSSTALPTRSPASGCSISRLAPCSVRPVANSRWIARSCRSRAIRSRSCSSARCSDSARCRASSSVSAACAAKPDSSSTSWSSNAGRPASRHSRSAPVDRSWATSGTATSGPNSRSWSGSGRARARESVRTSLATAGRPVRTARPASEPPDGTTRLLMRSASCPSATSTIRLSVPGAGSRMAAESASETWRAGRATRLSTSAAGVPADSVRVITPSASSHCSRRRLSWYSRALSMATPAGADKVVSTASSSGSNRAPPRFSVRYRLPNT